MALAFVPEYLHQRSYRTGACPFRVQYKPVSDTPAPLSWCAHHDYSDTRICNINQPCTAIAAIARDPNFQVTTALLWIRAGDARKRKSTRHFGSDSEEDEPAIILSDAIQGTSEADAKLDIREEKPDLGLFHLHRDRLAAAAEAFGWRHLDALKHNDTALQNLRDRVKSHIQSLSPIPAATLESRKVVIRITKHGFIDVTSAAVGHDTLNPSPTNHPILLTKPFMPNSLDDPPIPNPDNPPPTKIYLDRQPTRPSTLTTHKTTHRCIYTAARDRVSLPPTTPPSQAEVLLYNTCGEVIETSVCTIYFRRNDIWHTPAAICGPNLGVTRRLAIEKGLCRQGSIEIRDLVPGEGVWLSNAVRGFFRGVIAVDERRGSEGEDGKVREGRVEVGRSAAYRGMGS